MNIMTALFDQDYVTRMYGVDQRREGMKEGIKEAKKEIALNLIQCGVAKEIIIEATELSEKEIDALENDKNHD